MTYRLKQPLMSLAIFVLACIPRVLSGRFVTIDEAYHWFDRVDRFERAIADGNYAGTNLIGHPGVTTMWLGMLGDTLFHWSIMLGLVTANDDGASRALIRMPLGCVAALCVALAYPLLRRLFDYWIALVAVLLWATEPFLVAHAQLLHLDSLLTSFMTLSILAALVSLKDQKGLSIHYTPFILSSMFAGLAMLTKSPSIVLLPLIACLLALRGWRYAGVAGLRWAGVRLGVWCGLALLVWVALWPAAWVDLAGAMGRVFFQAQADGGSPHGWGNYFLGQALADPGPLFYLVAVPLRMTTWTLLGGLLAALIAMRRFLAAWRAAELAGFCRRYQMLLWLAFFVLLFLAIMSIPPKKFDRYLLPIFPSLDILAAAGLVASIRAVLRRFPTRIFSFSSARVVATLILVVLLSAHLAWYHPYELAFYNPLLGGSATALGSIPIGWGEGYELAGDFIRAQPNGADLPVAALYSPALDPFVDAGAAPMDWALEPGKVDYAVVYIDQIQRNYKPELFEPLRKTQRPLYTVVVHDIPYAEIYAIPPAVDQQLQLSFGDTIQLRGYSIDSTAIRSSGALTLTLAWEAQATPEHNYNLFVHVFDQQHMRVAQVDVPTGEPRWPTSAWTAGHYIRQVQRIPMPADLPDGRYDVVIGLYEPQNFQRLTLDPNAAHYPIDGNDALLVGTVVLGR